MNAEALCVAVLSAGDPEEKTRLAEQAGRSLAEDAVSFEARGLIAPDRPARPDRPRLRPPRDMAGRSAATEEGRLALLHALAHIEFNAVDLAFDLALRFADAAREAGLDVAAFQADWIRIGAEEARHFNALRDRLRSLGADYGSFDAHDGLWQAAAATSDSLLARLVVAPMVLEARGLDVTPGIAARLRSAGDAQSAGIVEQIEVEEIGHVAAGVRWFEALCAAKGLDPTSTFRRLATLYVPGRIKGPFNVPGRFAAGLSPAYYAGFGTGVA